MISFNCTAVQCTVWKHPISSVILPASLIALLQSLFISKLILAVSKWIHATYLSNYQRAYIEEKYVTNKTRKHIQLSWTGLGTEQGTLERTGMFIYLLLFLGAMKQNTSRNPKTIPSLCREHKGEVWQKENQQLTLTRLWLAYRTSSYSQEETRKPSIFNFIIVCQNLKCL